MLSFRLYYGRLWCHIRRSRPQPRLVSFVVPFSIQWYSLNEQTETQTFSLKNISEMLIAENGFLYNYYDYY